MKIKVSPEVARFNAAVEAADSALVWTACEVTKPDNLIALLCWAGLFAQANELVHALNEMEGKPT